MEEKFLGLKEKKVNPDTDATVVPKQEGFAMPAAAVEKFESNISVR